MNKIVKASNGKEFRIVNLTVEDAEALLNFFRQATLESEGQLLVTHAQTLKFTVDFEREFIAKAGEKLFALLNEDGKLVGTSDIRYPYNNNATEASFGIAILNEYQGIGLGTILIKHVIEIAKQKGIKLITIDAFETNTRAIKLYKKLGFVLTKEKKTTMRGEEKITHVILRLKLD